MRWLTVFSIALVSAGMFVHCEGRVCAPGSTQACLCVGNTNGVQSCEANGGGWQACQCSGGDAGLVDTGSGPDKQSNDNTIKPDASNGDKGVVDKKVCPTSCSSSSDCLPCGDKSVCSGSSGKCAAPFSFTYTAKAHMVDILLVIDNSGSMREEQAKLSQAAKNLVSALGSVDYQVGVISTDMDDPTHYGKLQGSPALLKSQSQGSTLLSVLQKNIQTGITGTSYEKPLDAMRAALSPKLLNDPAANKGLLRNGATLAILFLSDEDDCSHNGTIAETELDSEVCRLPKKETLLDDNGKPIPDAKGNPVKGHMEDLTPVAEYTKFLKSLNREVILTGLIGDPEAYKIGGGTIDPSGGCSKNAECTSAANAHKCIYNTPGSRKCGGCTSKVNPPANRPDADAVPGFRIHSLISSFGWSKGWTPVCAGSSDYQTAMQNFGTRISRALRYIPLPQKPKANPTNTLVVELVSTDGSTSKIKEAAPLTPSQSCTVDAACPGRTVCGSGSVCFGEGWVYIQMPPGQPDRVKLSEETTTLYKVGSKYKVSYLPE